MSDPLERMAHEDTLDLIRKIVELDASSPAHPLWLRHSDLAGKFHPAIWLWAKREPSDVRLLAELTMGMDTPGSSYGSFSLMSGFCLLASAWHDPRPATIPFKALVRAQMEPDEFGGANPSFSVDGRRLDGPSPWPDPRHESLAARQFHQMAHHAQFEENGSRTEWTAREVLERYDRLVGMGSKMFRMPNFSGEHWAAMAIAVEAAGQRSVLSACALDPAPSRPTAPRSL